MSREKKWELEGLEEREGDPRDLAVVIYVAAPVGGWIVEVYRRARSLGRGEVAMRGGTGG